MNTQLARKGSGFFHDSLIRFSESEPDNRDPQLDHSGTLPERMPKGNEGARPHWPQEGFHIHPNLKAQETYT